MENNINRQMANSIYKFILEKADGIIIPPLRFNFTDMQNDGLVFRSEQPESYYYFGDIGNLKYTVFYFSPNGDNSHLKQLNILDYILKRLNDLKELKIKNNIYNIITVYINGLPWPLTNWTITNLDGFDETSQIYSLELVIHFERKKGDENVDTN